MPSTEYSHKGQILRRFISQVELYPGKWGYRCALMVFPNAVMFDVYERGFKHRNLGDYFKCHVRTCGILHKSVTITPNEKCIPGEQMKKLLNFLDEKILPIVWKEGQFGYEIDKLGNIQRTWPLNDAPDAPGKILDAEIVDVPDEGNAGQEPEHSPTS